MVVFPPAIVPTAPAAVMVVVVLLSPSKTQDKEANLRQCQGKDSGQESKTKIYFHALHISSGLSCMCAANQTT